ncbi:MAG: polyprenyl synthetase family protein [Thomasclavelia sp.]|nr:polyprenyl synthetase family protein [Thomasclavelia sp.]
MNNIIDEINENLKKIIDSYPSSNVKNAMNYSLMAGGKRLRPLIFIQVLRSYQIDYHDYLDIACALEMIHTYSLIHDDLPCMDNDDLRRGKNTCHKEFNEPIALLAGDGLLTEASNVIMHSNVSNDVKCETLKILLDAAGIKGMIYGQELDMESENRQISLDEVKKIHHYKTGALIAASFEMAAVIADKTNTTSWHKIGMDVGLAFQIQDDILDVTKTKEELGKSNSDIENNKSTYVSLTSIDKSKSEVKRLINKSLEEVYSMKINHGLIISIIQMIEKREK